MPRQNAKYPEFKGEITTLDLAFQTTFQEDLRTWKKFLDMKSLKKYKIYLLHIFLNKLI